MGDAVGLPVTTGRGDAVGLAVAVGTAGEALARGSAGWVGAAVDTGDAVGAADAVAVGDGLAVGVACKAPAPGGLVDCDDASRTGGAKPPPPPPHDTRADSKTSVTTVRAIKGHPVLIVATGHPTPARSVHLQRRQFVPYAERIVRTIAVRAQAVPRRATNPATFTKK